MMSEMVTMPSVPPNSSTTMAMPCVRVRKLRSRSSARIVSGTNEGGTIVRYDHTIGAATFKIGHTILKAVASGTNIFNSADCYSTFISDGYNLSSDYSGDCNCDGVGGDCLSGPGDQQGIDPLLGPLQNNGGPTETYGLCTGLGVPYTTCTDTKPSSAIDGGDPSFTCTSCYDQRGDPFDRIRNGVIDIGSFELQQLPITVTVNTNPSALSFSVDGTTYTTQQRFKWYKGTPHTLDTTSPQTGAPYVRYLWNTWSDGDTDMLRTVMPTTSTTYTATFTTQYFLIMTARGGSVNPASGRQDAGKNITIRARGDRFHHFATWSGLGIGSYSGTNNPASITMGGPIRETGIFGR